MKTNVLIHETKRKMEQTKMRHLTEKADKTETEIVIFENKFKAVARAFQAAILRYQESSNAFKNVVTEDFTRRAMIIHPELSQEQMEKVMRTNGSIRSISSSLLDEVSELEEEHNEIRQIEESIAEIQELFNACIVLVIDAGETLDEIEVNMHETVQMAQEGKEDIDKAKEHTKKERKTKMKIVIAVSIGMLLCVCLLLEITGIFRLGRNN